MAYYYVSITPAPSSFRQDFSGYFNAIVSDEAYDDKHELLCEIEQNFVGIMHHLNDVDSLPDGVEDIRGRIYNEPDSIYALYGYDDSVMYFGVIEK